MTIEERRAKHAAYMRGWHKKNPGKTGEYRLKRILELRAKDREWYQQNRAAVLAKRKAARLADPEKFRARDQKIYWSDPQKQRDEINAYRAKKPKRTRASKCNHAAFDNIGPEAAYWIGFIMADGCCSGSMLRIALHAKDAVHLDKFAAFLNSNRVGNRDRWGCHFAVRSTRLVSRLRCFGVVERKSKIACAMWLQNDRDFWRGMIDGDGWISIRKGYPIIGLCGSRAIIEQFNDFAESIFGRRWVMQPMRSIWALSLPGTWAVRLIRELYEGCAVALDRKLARANEAMKWIPKRTSISSFQPTKAA